MDFSSGLPKRSLIGVEKILICGAALIAFLAITPLYPTVAIDPLDSSWMLGMNVATAQGMLGKAVIFTYGPYGSIYTQQYFPQTNTMMLLGGAYLAVAIAAGLLCLGGAGWRFAATGFALFLPINFYMDTRFLCLPMVMLILAFRVGRPAGGVENIRPSGFVQLSLGLLAAGLAMLSLIKCSFAAASLGTIVLVFIILFGAGFRRLAAGCVTLFIVAIPILWLLAQQPISSLPAFFPQQFSFAGGFASSMAWSGPIWRVGFFLGCSVLLLLLNRRLFTSGISGLCLLTGLALLLYLGFKEGFIRYDFGHLPTAAGIAAMSGWGVLLCGPLAIEPVFSLLAMLICWGVIIQAYTAPGLAQFIHMLETPYSMAARGVLARLDGELDPARSYADSLMEIRARQPLPALQGPTDLYSYDQAALFAAGLDWSPRPVFQSYSAWTPPLLRINAAHLLGADAPQNIVFSVQPIDRRFPALEDGASWPLLLSRYHFTGYAGAAAILQRRSAAGRFQLQPLFTGQYPMDRRVALPKPAGSILWAEIEIRPTLAGRIVNLVYKLPLLYLSLQYPGGGSETYRYIEGMGETGFVIAPTVGSTQNFIALTQNPASLPRASTFSMTTTGFACRWLWSSQYHMRLSVLTFAPN